MKALRLEGIGRLSVVEVEKPLPGPRDLLVRVEACGICGTDRHLLHGEFPSKPPVTLGHEFCGIVEAIGSEVSDIAIGARITGDPNIACGACPQCSTGRVNLCRNLRAIGIHRDGGFADYVLVPRKQAFELPRALDPVRGAFCEPLACCLHGVDMSGIRAGSSVIVLGGGVIGLLVVQLARLAGATTVILSTRQAVKRRLAEELGATATVDPSSADIVEFVTGDSGLVPGGVDVVIECAGVAETVGQATRLAKAGGTVVILGVMPQGETVEIEPFDILFRELRVLGSFINPFVHRRAAELVASGAIEIDKLISRRVMLDEAAGVIAHPPAAGEVKVLVIPGSA
ncbi:zinc-dependent alcohol dehydrogenase family protein [Ensifer adhaerens]|uniref:zinc-dependent alcohol dehydrogenase family protein n=1 Tax=Ensifer adhaerens TaxID=106592 RepID=UPI001CBFED40|nr:zinc-dependent alcohol dehydrogenase family protein [Ensifer adhaerens]MBZ7921712.1 zinc-dependent alcohol dehydrogenase family protein [Ensifer adhaerens]UAX94120.1 zinc-dependent alcohol dehydrogenase family protein [Ensifer adhaerens]UAY01754.1 zinc-dependent alcohol dehydrogenase family protein [Ensifer adhaerens]UAY09138.1 zinc-dependent alcohol dehydrogenase family protein [Ensifer adhaerens]